LEKDRSLQAKEIEKIFRLALEPPANQLIKSGSETAAPSTPITVTEAVSDKT
jgi:hypothetical protein